MGCGVKSIQDLISLSGKVAVVTGAANGIGEGIVRRLAEAGARVVLIDIDTEKVHALAHELSEQGSAVHPYVADVSDESQVEAAISFVCNSFGGVDILVNNAGIFPVAPIEIIPSQLFNRVIDVTLNSVFYTTRHSIASLKQRGGGSIINVTSIDALHPSMVGLAHYDSSKHAVWGFTKSAALEFAPSSIRVNAVAPGGVATPGVAAMMGADNEVPAALDQAFSETIPLGRMGNPDEIALAVLYLASDMSTYVTGEQIVVDGGALLR